MDSHKNERSVLATTSNAAGIYPKEITTGTDTSEFQGFIVKTDAVIAFEKLTDAPTECTDITSWTLDAGSVIPISGKNMVVTSGTIILQLRNPYN